MKKAYEVRLWADKQPDGSYIYKNSIHRSKVFSGVFKKVYEDESDFERTVSPFLPSGIDLAAFLDVVRSTRGKALNPKDSRHELLLTDEEAESLGYPAQTK